MAADGLPLLEQGIWLQTLECICVNLYRNIKFVYVCLKNIDMRIPCIYFMSYLYIFVLQESNLREIVYVVWESGQRKMIIMT